MILTVLMLTVVLGIGFESAELYASGIKEPEIEPGKPTIGIVHITFGRRFSMKPSTIKASI